MTLSQRQNSGKGAALGRSGMRLVHIEETKCRGFACLKVMRKTGTQSIINDSTVGMGNAASLVAMENKEAAGGF